MRPFRDLPISQKLLSLLTVTVGIALLLMGLGIVVSDSLLYRRDLQRGLGQLAEMIAGNSAAAVAFDDEAAASQILSSLRARPHLITACLYREGGTILAQYSRPGPRAAECPPPGLQRGVHFGGVGVTAAQPVLLNNSRIGTLVMAYDLGELSERARRYGALVVILLFGSGVAAWLLSAKLRPLVAMPLSQLAAAARSITETKNYSIRARKVSGDETGVLVDAFNEMLANVQARDAELLRSHDQLEQRVLQRTEALHESEERFRLMVERVQEYAIFTVDPSGLVTTWNAGAERIKGYRAEEVIGQNFSRFYTPEEVALGKPEEHLRAAAEQGRFEEEGWRVRKDGSLFLARAIITAMRDQEGKLIGFSKITRDVTERRREREALQLLANVSAAANSAEELDTVMSRCLQEICTLRNWPFGQAWIMDADQQTLICSPGAFYAELPCAPFRRASLALHFKKGEGLPGTVWEMGRAQWIDDITKDGTFPRRSVAAEVGLKAAFGFPIREGPTIFGVFEFFAPECRDPDPIFLDSIDRLGPRLGDIFGRKRAEQALRTSEQRFRAVADTANDAIISANAEGEIIYWNRGAERTFGYTSAEVMGKFLTIIMPERFHEAHRQGMRRFLATGDAHVIGRTVEMSGLRRDGTEFPVELSLATWRANEEVFFTGLVRDITRRKAAAEALEEQASELARSNAELQQFAYVASHDLQEPLRMVISYMQIIEQQYKGKLDADADEFIGYAVEGAARMRQLISDLLQYSRVGARGQELEPTDCGAVLEEARANLGLAIQESSAVITSDPLPVILADPTQMMQLFQNLIGNALKFRGSDLPRIHISANRDGGQWLFSVSDNGIGIAPEHYQRIFVIFQRLHARMAYEGTGIGLAICSKIVDRLGGRIWVESEIGKGSTFHFTIPVHHNVTARSEGKTVGYSNA